jgi:amino acid adenylation domain-containing protein/non-ribosomal peptide synthase protein (TIGR01720 family)
MNPALAGVVDAYGLTAMQEGMLYHTLADRGSGVYVNQIVTPVSGDLDASVLRSAWDVVVARHDTLRTAYVWDGLDEPLQVVHEAVDHPWEHVDLAHVAPGDRGEQVDRVLTSDRERGFDVAVAPLSRMLLIRTGEREWQWVWSFHHLIADGWSAQILLDEVIATYRASAEGRRLELPEQPPYRNFVAHYLARDTEAERTYWTQRLAGFAETLDLVVPGLPPAEGASGYRTQYRRLDRALTDDLVTLARSHHVTLNTVFVAIWALIVSRWAGTKDVVFGTTVAGRPASLEGAEQATGLFINTLPTRVRLPPAQRLGEWLNDIQRGQLDDRRFELASLADIQRWSDVPGGDALFESILVFENYPPLVDRRLGDSINLGQAHHIEQSNYPLAVLVIPGDQLTVGMVHDLSRLSEPAVESLLDQVGAVARAFVANPYGTVSEFSVVDHAHEARIAAISRGPELTVDNQTVVDMISEVATRWPDRRAVTFAGRHLTYAELDQASSRLARLLVRRGVERGAAVGVHLPRSLDLLVAILGILKAAAAYVPLDPAYPRPHLMGLIDDTAIMTIVTDSDLAHAMGEVADLIVIDREESDDPTVALPSVSADDLAYVIHTSGSTGRPKGVMVAHGTLAASTRARPAHYKEPVERFLLLSSYAFDSSIAGIFWTLTTGGALVLPEPNLERDVDALLELAAREQITHMLGLPTLYQVLLEHAGRGELDSLRVAIVAGEACPAGVLASHRGTVGHAELHNEYGPTEATVWCTVHRAEAGDEHRALPIGRPTAGSEIHLLDAYGHRVPLGFAGELCVGGAGVTLGYFGRPDLTAERFLTIPLDGEPQRIYRTGDLAAYAPDGTLVFLGRTDQQLKVRGHRIEAGAVEAQLRTHPDVADAAAIARPLAGRSGAQLVGYVVPNGPEFDPRSVSETLRRELPEYLVPDVLMVIDAIPHLPNGKLDVASLPDPRMGSHGPDPACDTPRTPEEEILASIWCDLLGLRSVGIHDDFFSLGGDSIVSIRMVSRARQAGLHIEPARIATDLTVERLAALARTTAPAQTANDRVTGPVPLSPIQAWFFDQAFAVPDHWNQGMLLALPDGVDEAALRSAVTAVLEHHDMLRARFVHQDGTWSQSIADDAATGLERIPSPSADLDPIVAGLQARLDLGNGPVVRCALIEPPAPARPVLCIVAHHLVVDAVSWSILIEDLTNGYRLAASGAPVTLPPRTTSFRAWTEHHLVSSTDEGLAAWRSQLPSGPDAASTPGLEAERLVMSAHLDREMTNHLLTDANNAYGTRPDELILAALTPVLADDSGTLHALVEGHGRMPSRGMDVSRTVGWFTTQYPLALQAYPDHAGAIKHTKEAVRSASNAAVDYGVQRYVHRHPELTTVEEPGVLVNYVGRTDVPTGGLLEALARPDDSSRHPENRMTHELELVALVDEAGLTVHWYHSNPLRNAEIAHMADAHISTLQSLIAHCLGEDVGGFTPSDFPAAGLGQDELDDFLDGLI